MLLRDVNNDNRDENWTKLNWGGVYQFLRPQDYINDDADESDSGGDERSDGKSSSDNESLQDDQECEDHEDETAEGAPGVVDLVQEDQQSPVEPAEEPLQKRQRMCHKCDELATSRRRARTLRTPKKRPNRRGPPRRGRVSTRSPQQLAFPAAVRRLLCVGTDGKYTMHAAGGLAPTGTAAEETLQQQPTRPTRAAAHGGEEWRARPTSEPTDPGELPPFTGKPIVDREGGPRPRKWPYGEAELTGHAPRMELQSASSGV